MRSTTTFRFDVPPMTPGSYSLTDLSPNQCRYPCTEVANSSERHRFCGRPTTPGEGNRHGSWCPEHLRIVWARGTREEQRAGGDERVRRVA